MTSVSITIRPWAHTWKLIDEKKLIFFEYLKKHTEIYIISYEKGKLDFYNHYQCYIKYQKNRRPDKIREGILKKLYKIGIEFSPEELKVGIKVKEIKRNERGVMGYVLKEEGKYESNLDQSEVEVLRKEYLTFKEKNNLDSKSYFRVNNKNYHIYIRNFIMENEEYYCDIYENEDIKKIIGEMINRGYYMTFLTSRNIIEKVLYVKSFLNKNGREFIDHIYDKCERMDIM